MKESELRQHLNKINKNFEQVNENFVGYHAMIDAILKKQKMYQKITWGLLIVSGALIFSQIFFIFG